MKKASFHMTLRIACCSTGTLMTLKAGMEVKMWLMRRREAPHSSERGETERTRAQSERKSLVQTKHFY